MAITLHVYPVLKGWAVRREGSDTLGVFPTQKEAIKHARSVARDSAPGQLVVLGKDGRIKDYATYGLPKVLDPHGKTSGAGRIEKAIGRIALERLLGNPHPARA